MSFYKITWLDASNIPDPAKRFALCGNRLDADDLYTRLKQYSDVRDVKMRYGQGTAPHPDDVVIYS